MNKQNLEINDNENVEEKMTADEERLLDEFGIFGESRRQFLGQMANCGIARMPKTRAGDGLRRT